MVFNMRNPLRLICLLLSTLTPGLARGGCTDPNLFAQTPEFQALQTSRINALLQFGETHNLCFGVEYIDAALLTNLTDIHIEASMMIGEAIKLILGKEQLFSVEVREGVIEIGRAASEPHIENIFDHVLPAFDARRGPLQETSNALHMYLVTDLNPEITGFAGHYFSGDLKDQVGPFREYNRTLRYLLNAILAQSKGGAWIARIAWKLRGNFKIPEKRRIWTFVEYGVPGTGYSGILANIAGELEHDTHAALPVPPSAGGGALTLGSPSLWAGAWDTLKVFRCSWVPHPFGVWSLPKGAVFDSSCTRFVFQGFRFPQPSHINRPTLDIFLLF